MIVKDPQLLKRMHAEATGCEFCREAPAIHCHHIQPRGQGGGNRLDVAWNLIMLCLECHNKADANRIPDVDLAGLAWRRETWRLNRLPKETEMWWAA